MNRRQFIVVGIGAGLTGCTGLGNGGSDVQDSDGDGVIDSEDYAPNDPDVQEKADVSGGADTETDASTDSQTTETPTDTPPPESGGWSVRFEYDGRWQGTVSVTTPEGDSHQAFDDEGGKTIDIEAQMGVDTQDVFSITVTGQKETGDDQTLRIEIRKDGETVAVGSTDEPHGETVVTHDERSDADTGETPTDTPASTNTPAPTDTPAPDPSGWSVRIEHDGSWTVSVSVTTPGGDSHQAFDGEGDQTVDVDEQMGVAPGDVESITATGQKEGANNRTLRIEIRKGGDVVAEGSTDDPAGQVVVTHHE